MSFHFISMFLLVFCLESGIDPSETDHYPRQSPVDLEDSNPHTPETFYEQFENDPQFVSWAYYLWRDAGRGTRQTELSAWIGWENDHFFFHRWPHSHKTRQESWQGQIPHNVWANIHTHPNDTLPRPSGSNGTGIGGDVAFAHATGLIVYTVHRDGIFRYHPKTKQVTQVWNGPNGTCKAWWQLAEERLVNHYANSAPDYTKQYREMQQIGQRWKKLSELREKIRRRKPDKSWTRKEKQQELKAVRQEILRVRSHYLTVIMGIDLDRRLTMALSNSLGEAIEQDKPLIINEGHLALQQ